MKKVASTLLFASLIASQAFSQNNCASPLVISTLPYTNSLSTCSAGSDYDSPNYPCLKNSFVTMSGEDLVLTYTPANDECVHVSVTNVTSSNAPDDYGVAIINACPGGTGALCAGSNIAAYNDTTGFDAKLKGGTKYYIIIDCGNWPITDPTVCFSFNLSIKSRTCPYVPPPLTGNEGGVNCGNNSGFENGDFTGWSGKYNNSNSNYAGPPINPPINGFSPATTVINGNIGACMQNGGNPPGNASTNPRHTLTTGTGTDPNTDNKVKVLAPGGGQYSVRLGNQEAYYGCECMQFTFKPTKAFPIFTYLYAIVLQDPTNHTLNNRPRFEVNVTDSTGTILPCGGQYIVTSAAGVLEGFERATAPTCGGTDDIWYRDWRAVSIDLSAYINTNVTIKYCVADCSQGGHYGYCYIDAYCKSNKISGVTLCSTGGAITLTAPIGFTNYSWYGGGYPVSGPVLGTGSTLTVPSPSNGTIYTVIYESQSGQCPINLYATDTLKVLDATVSGNFNVCNTDSGTVQLLVNANDGGATYSWSPSTGLSCTNCPNPILQLPLLSTTVYTVTVNSPSGCSITKYITANVQNCGITVITTPNSVCSSQCTNISATGAGGTAPYTYNWQPGNLNGQSPSVCPSVTTTYTVTGTDATGLTKSATAVVTVNAVPVVNLGNNITVCGNINQVLNAGNPGAGYTWSTGAFTQTITVTQPGTYWVNVSNNGCTDTDSITISIQSPVTVSDAGFCTGDTVVLTAKNQGTYSWSTGAITPSVIVYTPGTYWVITSTVNCTYIDTFKVSETPAIPQVYRVPNVFSPNEDNNNDFFDVKGLDLSVDYNIKIYDRWGLLMFESSDPKLDWNGKFKDKAAPTGVYYFIIQFTDPCHKTEDTKHGFVHLLR